MILSLFPGIGLLDRAFEEQGYVVVRGPDALWGGDIRSFHVRPGVFEGVIGGPPCQSFSKLVNLIRAQGHEPRFGNLIPEFERVTAEAAPRWFLMENVPDAPVPAINGYQVHTQRLNNRWVPDGNGYGAEQHRLRVFSFGSHDGRKLEIITIALEAALRHETVVTGTAGGFTKGTGPTVTRDRVVPRSTRQYAGPAPTVTSNVGGKGKRAQGRAVRQRSGPAETVTATVGPRARDRMTAPGTVMMPARLALALQADGWWLRSKIVWEKPNPMPESITDRPTSSYEEVFLMARSERYFYDAAAIAEPASEATHARVSQTSLKEQHGGGKTEQYAQGFPGKKNRDRTPVEIVQAIARKAGVGRKAAGNGDRNLNTGKQNESFQSALVGPVIERNARNVWTISTQPYPEAHFATFPEELARRCIVAGSSPRTCEQCGAPWRRVVVATGGTIGRAWNDHQDDLKQGQRAERRAKGNEGGYRRVDKGWKAGCRCEQQGTGRSIVLDPFGGSGTVAQVATGNGRDAIYIDLNAEYLDLARQRIGPLLCRDP